MNNQLIIKNRLIPSVEQTIEICNLYGIGDLISIDGEIENSVNVNLKILTQTGNYVIRIFTAEPERLNFIIDTLKFLNRNNVPVLLPLKNTRGQYYSKLGSYMLQISKYEHGYPFAYGKYQAWSNGKTLRRFHDVLFNIKNKIEPTASIYPSRKILKNGITGLQKLKDRVPISKISSIMVLYDGIINKWEIRSTKLPKTIIHGDWHQGNQLYSESGEVHHIMDFEFMTRAERLFDIAYAIWHLQLHRKSLDIAQCFMDGYGPISHEEAQLLPLEIARVSYFFVCTASLSLNPEYEVCRQINQQYPFIKWALSRDGENEIRKLCVIR